MNAINIYPLLYIIKTNYMLPKTMKAAVVHAFGEPLQIEELTVPEPRTHQILVKVIASVISRAVSS